MKKLYVFMLMFLFIFLLASCELPINSDDKDQKPDPIVDSELNDEGKNDSSVVSKSSDDEKPNVEEEPTIETGPIDETEPYVEPEVGPLVPIGYDDIEGDFPSYFSGKTSIYDGYFPGGLYHGREASSGQLTASALFDNDDYNYFQELGYQEEEGKERPFFNYQTKFKLTKLFIVKTMFFISLFFYK